MASSFLDGNADLIEKTEDLNLSNRGGRSSRGKARGGRGGSAGGGHGRDVLISKSLSKLLRHQAENEGLKLDGEGFARLDEVVSSCFGLVLGNLTHYRGL